MKKDQPLTIGILQEELQKQGEDIKKDIRSEFKVELQKQGEDIKKDIRTEFKVELQKQGKNIKRSFRTELKEELKKQEDRIKDHLDTVYENFDAKQALMAENILDVREKMGILTEMVEKNTEDIEIIKLNIELIRSDLKTKVEKEEFRVLEKRVLALEQKERKRVSC